MGVNDLPVMEKSVPYYDKYGVIRIKSKASRGKAIRSTARLARSRRA